MRAGLAVALALIAAPALAAPAAHPRAPCTRATAVCAEWVNLEGGSARTRIYRSFPLGVRNPNVRRALIMVHGALRNADHYFTTATAAAFIAGALKDTVIIAPSFASADGECHDKLAPREVSWGCGKDSWRSGGAAASNPGLTSFGFIDTLLAKLADRKAFPNLEVIVIAGHSAGGQFVERYEMANRAHEGLRVPVAYVVANPSSYAWPDASRVLPLDDGAPDAAKAGWSEGTPHVKFSYGPFDDAKAPGFDAWPYGLEHRVGGYTSAMSDDQLKRQLVSRPVTYLLSQVDTLPLGGFDGSPQAMAQGATRRARGEAFVNYIDTRMGAHAKALIVPECGHNDRCVFTTDAVLPVIFPGSR
jgi:hypothetical protein